MGVGQQNQLNYQFLLRDSIQHRATICASIESDGLPRFWIPYQESIYSHVVEWRVEDSETINLACTGPIFILRQIAQSTCAEAKHRRDAKKRQLIKMSAP